jgi:hypothetical protein
MSFTFNERPESRDTTSNPPTYTSRWVADGSNDAAFVKAISISSTPALVATVQGILYRQDIQIKSGGHKLFYAEVSYGLEKRELGQWRFNFDTTGGTLHIKSSKSSVKRYSASTSELGSAAATAIPKFNQLIGVHGDEVDGCEIIIPVLKLNVFYSHPLGVVTIAKAKQLAQYTGTVNSANFLTFAGGEVLFLGATGSDGTDAEAEVQYQFACSQNATGLTIGDITGIAKEGHDYLWIRYKNNVSIGYPVKQPEFIYIERVYDRVDLASVLGFG